MAKENNSISSAIWSIFVMLLQLIFITLKVCGIITWSWWWVFVPIWGSLALSLTVGLIFLLIAVIAKWYISR